MGRRMSCHHPAIWLIHRRTLATQWKGPKKLWHGSTVQQPAPLASPPENGWKVSRRKPRRRTCWCANKNLLSAVSLACLSLDPLLTHPTSDVRRKHFFEHQTETRFIFGEPYCWQTGLKHALSSSTLQYSFFYENLINYLHAVYPNSLRSRCCWSSGRRTERLLAGAHAYC